MSDQEKYFKMMGAVLRDSELGTSQGLMAFRSEDEFLDLDAQGLWGVSWESLAKAGKELWEKVSPKLYPYFCDTESETHSTLAGMIKEGSSEIAPAIASVVAGAILGLPFIPAAAVGTLAYVIAKLILTTVFESTYELGCEKWGDTLPQEDEAGEE